MTLIVILICLIAERLMLEHERYRDPRWFATYFAWLRYLPLPAAAREGPAGVMVALLPPLLLVGLLQGTFSGLLLGLPELAFGALVLLFCLGPRNLTAQVQGFRKAGNPSESRRIAEQIIGAEPPAMEPALSHAIASAILVQANSRGFAVLFWFALLGPLGAAGYRLAHLLRDHAAPAPGRSAEFVSAAARLPGILDWLPARLTAFGYALGGSFDGARQGWRSYQQAGPHDLPEDAGEVLTHTGLGALGIGEHEASTDAVEGALALVRRGLAVWLLVLALPTLAIWAA